MAEDDDDSGVSGDGGYVASVARGGVACRWLGDGGVKGEVRCFGLGDLIPRGGGTRLGGGVEESSSVRILVRVSKCRYVGGGIGSLSSEIGARVGWSSFRRCSFSPIAKRENWRAAIERGDAEPNRSSLIRIFPRMGECDGSSSTPVAEGERVPRSMICDIYVLVGCGAGRSP
jgi:hypothetical protein